jgi:hypothetical protein
MKANRGWTELEQGGESAVKGPGACLKKALEKASVTLLKRKRYACNYPIFPLA